MSLIIRGPGANFLNNMEYFITDDISPAQLKSYKGRFRKYMGSTHSHYNVHKAPHVTVGDRAFTYTGLIAKESDIFPIKVFLSIDDFH